MSVVDTGPLGVWRRGLGEAGEVVGLDAVGGDADHGVVLAPPAQLGAEDLDLGGVDGGEIVGVGLVGVGMQLDQPLGAT